MKLEIINNLNIPTMLRRIDDDEFWKFGAETWRKLISPYTPMQTGTLFESVATRPKEIEYEQPYAHYAYRGILMVDPDTGSSYAKKGAKKVYTSKQLHYQKEKDKHPLATKEWDKVAEPKQGPKLVDAMQDYIDSGRLKLNE